MGINPAPSVETYELDIVPDSKEEKHIKRTNNVKAYDSAKSHKCLLANVSSYSKNVEECFSNLPSQYKIIAGVEAHKSLEHVSNSFKKFGFVAAVNEPEPSQNSDTGTHGGEFLQRDIT